MITVGFLASIKRQLRQMCSRWLYLFAMLVIPIVTGLFLLSLMSNGLPMHIPVAIVDLDNSSMSQKLVRTIASAQEIRVVEKAHSEAEAMSLIKKGEIYGFYLIPKDFARDVLGQRSPEIAYFTNNIYYIPSSFLYRTFKTNSILASGAVVQSYLVQSGATDARHTQALLQPVPLISHPIHNPQTNYAKYMTVSFIPSVLALMIMLVTSFSIWHEEKRNSSRQWLQEAHNHISVALLGKLLPQTVIFFGVALFLQSLMFGWGHFPMNCSILQLVATTLLFVLAYQSLGVFICGIIPNLRWALSICSLIGILTFSLGAFSFPYEDMYGGIAALTYLLPARYYFLIYTDQVLNGYALYFSRFYYVALLIYLLLPLIVVKRIKKHALNPVYVP